MQRILNRQMVDDLDQNIYEQKMNFLVDRFGEKWISSLTGTNPLQRLMTRKDQLSTTELFFFAFNLSKMWSEDTKWTLAQIKTIKEGDAKNRQGAFFEINALSMFSTLDQKIIPAKRNNPGIDGVCQFSDGRSLNISVKNYGVSTHHENFLRYAKMAEVNIIKQIEQRKILQIHLLIGSFKSYPEKKDWEILQNNIGLILDKFSIKTSELYTIADFWIVRTNLLEEDNDTFHSSKSSFGILIASNYHQNEKKNLFDKLEEACANLNRHGNTENVLTKNAIVIRLSELVGIEGCKKWAMEYLETYPEKPISAVVFYQPTIATSVIDGKKTIYNCFQVSTRSGEQCDWLSEEKLRLSFPTGFTSTVPPDLKIMRVKERTFSDDNLTDVYWYQSGQHYKKAWTNEEGNLMGYLGNPGPGIFVHSILEIFDTSPSITLGGHFPPDERLLVI